MDDPRSAVDATNCLRQRVGPFSESSIYLKEGKRSPNDFKGPYGQSGQEGPSFPRAL